MVTTVTVEEVTEFSSAVAGVEIQWIRTDQGFGPASMVSSGDDRVAVSYGGVDFSTLLNSEIPVDLIGLQLVTCAPSGMRWCGSEAHEMELRLYRPGTSVFGNVPAGSRAVTLVASMAELGRIDDDLGLADRRLPHGAGALAATNEVRELNADLVRIANDPELLDQPSGTTRLLETVARALTSVSQGADWQTPRGFDSREIVATCLEYVETNMVFQPTISELCRVAYASESRLRQAFVEMLGIPPIQYFQIRVLSRLREDLLAADPRSVNVTTAATSLGLTQLGRVAGRYRRLFGETPRETLRRR